LEKFNISKTENTESPQERNPYGYSAPLSAKCEIPLVVLKQAFETFGSECDEDEWETQNIAMVVRPTSDETEDGQEPVAATVLKTDDEASSKSTEGKGRAISGAPPKKGEERKVMQ
jgi:hypothetical protein